MLEAVSKYIKNVSVLRRLLFAVVHLPSSTPNFWGVAVEFATKGKDPQTERIASLNIVIDKFHFKGHKVSWCHKHCNPHLFPELN